jgi:fumarate hydratase, class II
MNVERRRWGHQTDLALENFPISGEPVPWCIIRALAMIKAEAARVNASKGVVDAARAESIRAAAEEVVAGGMADDFPVDLFQTGSGTSTNMNLNEVLASRASELSGLAVHPNDHVNASQSSNDTFPTAVRIASVELAELRLVPELRLLAASLRRLAAVHDDTVKLGRTHLMDAVPMTFGQEVGAWARAVELGVDRVASAVTRAVELPIGGTAVGTGINAPIGFGRDVTSLLRERTGLPFVEAVDHFEAQATLDAIAELSGAAKVVALSLNKIAGDLRLLGSGPVGGLAEIRLPALQAGSSIMPGKVNPVVPEAVQQVVVQVVGNDAAITFASTLSTLQLTTAWPVVGRAITSSLGLLAAAASVLRTRCIDGLEPDVERMRRNAQQSPTIVTAIAPAIGYDAAATLARSASEHGISISEAIAAAGLPSELADLVGDPLTLARPASSTTGDHELL